VLQRAQQLVDEGRSVPEVASELKVLANTERVAAAMGELESAPIEFQATCDVTRGGVLLALPALLVNLIGEAFLLLHVLQKPRKFANASQHQLDSRNFLNTFAYSLCKCLNVSID
jgi:hypothetical protein